MRKDFRKYIPLLIVLIMAFNLACIPNGFWERLIWAFGVLSEENNGTITEEPATGYPYILTPPAYDESDWIVYPPPPPAAEMPEPEPTAAVTYTPPAAETPEPVQFTVSGEFLYAFSDTLKDCTPGKGRLTFTLWNVGAQGGDEFASVEVVLLELPHAYFEKITASEDRGACITRDYFFNWSAAEGLTFSGGPNGIIEGPVIDEEKQIWVRGEWGRVVDGKVLIFGVSEIPVPDPSVFDGF